MDNPEPQDPADPSRRRFLARAGVGGVIFTIGTALVPLDSLLSPAFGQTATTSVPATDDGTAAFAQSIELALVGSYQAAATGGKVLTRPATNTLASFSADHQQHATAFATAARSKATNKANTKLLDVVTGQLHAAADEKAVLQIAYSMETAAAATYLYVLGLFRTAAPLQLAASILPVESQHAVVLGQMLGKDPKATPDYLPSFITPDPALTTDKYPVA
jgi:hypothetical protein